MTAQLVAGAWLVAVWVALWGALSAANVLSGVLVAALLLTAFPLGPTRSGRRVRPVALAKLVGYFVYKLVEANLVMAWEVVTPTNRINNAIVAVPTASRDEVVMTLLANAISLTPGTLTLEARREPPTLYVHVLHLRSVEASRREMQRLEEHIIAAFPGEVPADETPERTA